MEIADQCLYAAKRSGRNAWVGIIPDLDFAQQGEVLPTSIPELVRAGVLPTVSSLESPVIWAEPDERK